MSGPMTLRNFGGIYQLVIENAEDLARIDTVDPARWAATSAPLRDLHVDPALLAFIDTENNGRIRVAHLLAARDWLFARLSDLSGVTAKSDSLKLSHLNLKHEEGERVLHGAQHVMRELGLPADRDSISLEEVRAFRAGYAKTLRNGDGVVPPELVKDEEVAAFARDIIATVGSVPDASGMVGVAEPQLSRYLEGARAYLTWKTSGKATPGVLPLGDETESAWAQIQALDAKIDEQFLRCEFMKQENLNNSALKLSDEEIHALRAKDAQGIEAYLEASPLAEPDSSCVLPIGGKVNPAFQDKWDALSKILMKLLPSKATLDRAGWRAVKAEFANYTAWIAAKPPEPFDKIGDEKLEAQLAGPLPERLRAIIADDAAAAPELAHIATLEKLILFQRWLIELANNFVNFSAIYNPEKTAMVEMGSFVVDGRRLEFCLKVETAARAAHKVVASDSLAFLVYAQITEADGKPPEFEIVAPVTSGERGRLKVGKRGIFIDRVNREWDAIIVEIVENPISIKEAALSPFRRLQKFISARIEQFAQSQLASREAAMQASTSAAVTSTGTAAPAPAAPPPAPAPAANSGGIQTLVLTASVAVAALGAAFASLISAFTHTPALKLLGIIAAVIAVIAGISAFLGWLKLRRRDMGLILEAGGWAINAEMKITRRVGITFTRKPNFPKGTRTEHFDVLSRQEEAKEQDRKRRNWRILFIFVVAMAASALLARYWYWHWRG